MSVILRLARFGKKKKPFYRIVATEKLTCRDGKFIEIVGHFNPMIQTAQVFLKEDRVKQWLDKGAKTTEVVGNLIKKNIPGLLEEKEKNRIGKIQDSRRKRKERAKARVA